AQRYHAVLGDTVDVWSHAGTDACQTRQGKDHAAALLAHLATGVLDAVEDTVQQHRHGPVPVRLAGLQQGADHTDHAGVVDHAVEPTVLLHGKTHCRSHLFLTGHVSGNEAAAQLPGQRLAGGCIDIRQHHPGTFRGESTDRGCTYAAGRAGDQYHPVLHLHAALLLVRTDIVSLRHGMPPRNAWTDCPSAHWSRRSCRPRSRRNPPPGYDR